MIGLIDVDQTGFPNLALMKLSAWYKAHGEQTALLKPSKDEDDEKEKREITKGGYLYNGLHKK